MQVFSMSWYRAAPFAASMFAAGLHELWLCVHTLQSGHKLLVAC